jgi:hypothetical protein
MPQTSFLLSQWEGAVEGGEHSSRVISPLELANKVTMLLRIKDMPNIIRHITIRVAVGEDRAISSILDHTSNTS